MKKFIETSTEGKFINIDFIVSFKKSWDGYFVTMCNGSSYELGDYKEAEMLFEYLKSINFAKIPKEIVDKATEIYGENK